MKSVMLSIKPKWCFWIMTGAKTLEIRKTKPAGIPLGIQEHPIKCYIYCTGVKRMPLKDYCEVHRLTGGSVDDWHGKVIAEFTCDEISEIRYTMNGIAEAIDCNRSCLTPDDLAKYGKGKPLYGWGITDLKVYDEPKELSEFCFPPEKYCEKELCGRCPYEQVANQYGEYKDDCNWQRPLSRPPQSWCFVERTDEK